MDLTLFFTRKVSLKTWDQVGMFDREVAIYKRLQEKKYQINFITYGNRNDLLYCDRIPGIRICCNRWNLPPRLYEKLIPILHGKILRISSLIKTNQTNGADVALSAARIWRKPFIARCGYMWSDLAQNSFSEQMVAVKKIRNIEEKIFTNSNGVVVTTPRMKDYIVDRYGLSSSKIHIIPNYVLTNYFSPGDSQPNQKQICYIGRLAKEKNVISLVKACQGLDVQLVMVGDGYLRNDIMQLARQLQIKIILKGNVPHLSLPDILRQSSVFILVSPHEGHPKTLIEAMSCGVAVIGADSPGIQDIIRHGQNGWLCRTDPESIRKAILTLIDRDELRRQLGENARKFSVQHYALDTILKRELEVYQWIFSTNS